MTNVNEGRLQLVESTLTTALLAWSATSVAVGTIMALVGRKAQNDDLVGFGRQTAAWGAVDALIAGAGVLSRRRRAPLCDEEAAKKAGSLRKLLLVNRLYGRRSSANCPGRRWAKEVTDGSRGWGCGCSSGRISPGAGSHPSSKGEVRV